MADANPVREVVPFLDTLLDVPADDHDYTLDGDDSVIAEDTPGEVDE